MLCHNKINILVTLRPTTKFHCYSIKTLKECGLTVLLLCNNDDDDRNRYPCYNNNNNNNNMRGEIWRYYIEDKAFHTIIYANAWKQGKTNHVINLVISFVKLQLIS